jgi:hypothetical protein
MVIDWVKIMWDVNCIEWKYVILVRKGEDTDGKWEIVIGVDGVKLSGDWKCCLWLFIGLK